MKLGMIGLGRMGANMVQRLLKGGHNVVVYDKNTEAIDDLVSHGAIGACSIKDLVDQLTEKRVVWVMVPAGNPTEMTINNLATSLSAGDVIVDGGNSNYKDSIRRSASLNKLDIFFLDVGTSGGVWGITEGYSMMVGGDNTAFRIVEPAFQALAPAPDKGYGHVGPSGAGHFVKMVHNGIEYGLMQAYAEGFELMQAKREFDLDLAQISENWRYGSVVRSWLLDLTAIALHQDQRLEDVQSYIEDSGEGRWALEESIELAIPIPVISASLQARFRSRQNHPYSSKLVAAMRNQFGGHSLKRNM